MYVGKETRPMRYQLFFSMRFASSGEMPAIFQKYQPAAGPASFPMAIRQSAGGFCSPRSQREITIDEHFKCFPNSNWFSPSSSRSLSNSPRPSWQGSGYELSGPGHSCLQDNKHSVYYETHTADPCGKTEVKPVVIGDP